MLYGPFSSRFPRCWWLCWFLPELVATVAARHSPLHLIQSAATPAITPNGGTFSTSYPTVTITDSTPGAIIHYTIDGSTPTSASPMYSTAFILNSAATVQAIATAAGYSTSSVASAAFKLQTASGNYTITVTPTAVANWIIETTPDESHSIDADRELNSQGKPSRRCRRPSFLRYRPLHVKIEHGFGGTCPEFGHPPPARITSMGCSV